MDLSKLKAKAGAARTTGSGGPRRAQKATSRSSTVDDKKLQATLKRLHVTQIPGIEEVNIVQRDQTVISFKNPKVQASIQANTYVVSGQATTKRIEDMLPNFGMNMGGGAPDMATLQQLLAKMGAAPGGMPKVPTIEEEGDEDVPDLVENFEAETK